MGSVVGSEGRVVLALDAALSGCSAGVVGLDGVMAEHRAMGARGQVAALPAMAQAVLSQAGIAPAQLAMVAVTIGPGSFTGIRAALSLAHGIALAARVPLVGVTVGEALAVPDHGRLQWVAVDTRRGRVFLDRGTSIATVALDALPAPPGPVSLAGDAAIAVASRLAARGADVLLLPARMPTPAGVAAAGRRRVSAGPDSRPVQPLYVDPPEARPAKPA
jgi:tRNA threonylcarbamoyl adenosine modification protein YeaZ